MDGLWHWVSTFLVWWVWKFLSLQNGPSPKSKSEDKCGSWKRKSALEDIPSWCLSQPRLEPQEPVEAAGRVVASPGAVAKFFLRGVDVFWFAPGTGCWCFLVCTWYLYHCHPLSTSRNFKLLRAKLRLRFARHPPISRANRYYVIVAVTPQSD